ncbi:MAG: hypothetical protein Q9192_007438 [Flavoplaca navasiana]
MADEFVESCLPIFRERELEDDQRLEEVQKVISTESTLRGQQLETLTLRVAHLCRERIQSEAASQAASLPSRPGVPQVRVHRPSRRSSPGQELSAGAAETVPAQNTSPSLTTTPTTRRGRLNPNAREFTPGGSSSPSQRPAPIGTAYTPSTWPRTQHSNSSAEEQRARYQARIRSINAGIKLIDDFLVPREKERIRQAQAEIAVLQAEHDDLTREFLVNFPDDKGTWSLHEGEGAKRVRGWTVRKMQIDVLKTFIKECPETVLRNLEATREALFENLFPEEGEMGPAE